MIKKEIKEKLLKCGHIGTDNKVYVTLPDITSTFNLNYTIFLIYMRENNTNGLIGYKKIGATKLLEVNDLLVDVVYYTAVRNDAIENLERLKNELKK